MSQQSIPLFFSADQRATSDFKPLPERGRPSTGSSSMQFFEETVTNSLWIGKYSENARNPDVESEYARYYFEYKEWLGLAFYQLLDILTAPQVALSLQPSVDEQKIHCLHLMSKFISDYQPLGRNFIEDYLIAAKSKSLQQVSLLDGEIVPLRGFGAAMAAACFIYDQDCIGGGGYNMGYVSVLGRDEECYAKIIKIDAGFAFSFLDEDGNNDKQYTHNPKSRNFFYAPGYSEVSCDFIKLAISIDVSKINLWKLPGSSGTAYINIGNKLFFIDKGNDIRTEITIANDKLAALMPNLVKINPKNTPVEIKEKSASLIGALSLDQIEFITAVTGHMVEKRYYRLRYDELTESDKEEFSQTARHILQIPASTFKALIDQVVVPGGFTRAQADRLYNELLIRRSKFIAAYPEIGVTLQQEIYEARQTLKTFLSTLVPPSCPSKSPLKNPDSLADNKERKGEISDVSNRGSLSSSSYNSPPTPSSRGSISSTSVNNTPAFLEEKSVPFTKRLPLLGSPTASRIFSDRELSEHAIDKNNNCLFNAVALGLMGLIAQAVLFGDEIFKKLSAEKIKEEKTKLSKEQWQECIRKMQDYLKTGSQRDSLDVQHSLAPWLRQIAVLKLEDEQLGIRYSFADELCSHILDDTPSDLLRDKKSDFVQKFESIKSALVLKKPKDAKSLEKIKTFEQDVQKRIREWFNSGIGFKLYRDHMVQEGVWGGGPEARILGEFFGITLIMGHGSNPMRFDIGNECDFGKTQVGQERDIHFTEEEYSQLRSKELIIGKAFDPIHPILRFSCVSDPYLSKALAELPSDLSKKFSQARKIYYQPPKQTLIIHNPQGNHWSALSNLNGNFNVMACTSQSDIEDSKNSSVSSSTESIQEKSSEFDRSTSESDASSLNLDETVKSPSTPLSPSFSEEGDELTEKEFKKNPLGGFTSQPLGPFEMKNVTADKNPAGSLSFAEGIDDSQLKNSASLVREEKSSDSLNPVLEPSSPSGEESKSPIGKPTDKNVLLDAFDVQSRMAQEASLQLKFAQSKYGLIDDKSYPGCKTFQMPSATSYLIERTELLGKIAHQLHAQPSFMVAHGLGGSGKTQLARRYAQLAATAGKACGEHKLNYQAVLWMHAECDLGLQFQWAAEAFCNYPGLAPQEAAARVYQHLRDKKALIVFDNSADIDTIRPFLPPPAHTGIGGFFERRSATHVLITSRNPITDNLPALTIEGFTEEEAHSYVKQRLPDAKDTEIDRLLDTITTLPLTLSHAVAYIAAENCPLADYPRHFVLHQFSIDYLLADMEQESQTLFSTFLLSIAHLQRQHPCVTEMLQTTAFLVPEDIPLELLQTPTISPAINYTQEQLQAGVSALIQAALLQPGKTKNHVTIHRLVQQVVRHQMSVSEQSQCLTRVMQLVVETYPEKVVARENAATRDDFTPHLYKLLEHCDTGGREEDLHLGFILFRLGQILSTLGNEPAGDFLRRSLKIYEFHEGPDHFHVACVLRKLGQHYLIFGEAQEAHKLMERAITIFETHKDDLQIATTLEYLSDIYTVLGKHEQRRDILRRALRINREFYGCDNIVIAKTLLRLADAYAALENPQQQCDLLQRALEIAEEHFGRNQEQPMILESLGNAHLALGNNQKAAYLLRRTLKIKEKLHGLHHWQVAITLINLANVQGKFGNIKQKQDLLLRAIKIVEEDYACNRDHPYAAFYLTHLVVICSMENEPAIAIQEAKSLYWNMIFHPSYNESAATIQNALKITHSQGFSLTQLLYAPAEIKEKKRIKSGEEKHTTSDSSITGMTRSGLFAQQHQSGRSAATPDEKIIGRTIVGLVDAITRYLEIHPSRTPLEANAPITFASCLVSACGKGMKELQTELENPDLYSIPPELVAMMREYIAFHPVLLELDKHPELTRRLKLALNKGQIEELRQCYGTLPPILKQENSFCLLM